MRIYDNQPSTNHHDQKKKKKKLGLKRDEMVDFEK